MNFFSFHIKHVYLKHDKFNSIRKKFESKLNIQKLIYVPTTDDIKSEKLLLNSR